MTVRNIGYGAGHQVGGREQSGSGSRRRPRAGRLRQPARRYRRSSSGGQQQRVASRGIVARPDLVLFDEPLRATRRARRCATRSGHLHELQAANCAVFVTPRSTDERWRSATAWRS